MADVVETGHVALTHGEDSDEVFQQDAEKVAEEFVKLCLKDSDHLIPKGISRRKETDTSPDNQIAFVYVPDQSNAVGTPAYKQVAERLRVIGDQVDDDLVQRAINKSVFNIGQGEFTELCRVVLTSSYKITRSGWQQVSAVYYCLARIVRELRQNYHLSEQLLGQRETLLMGFVGPVLQELGLRTWIDRHGGLRQVPSEADTNVPILGSSV
ncbi:hypothetical protein EMCRGX_G025408 [Ephydatia muelleri]|eukprot:Em0021g243a